MTYLSNKELNELSELEKKATPGEWFHTCYEHVEEEELKQAIWTVGPNSTEENWETDTGINGYGIYKKDAELISTSRNSLPSLLAEIRETRRLLKIAHKSLEQISNWGHGDNIYNEFADINDAAHICATGLKAYLEKVSDK